MIDTGSMLSKDFGWQRGKEITGGNLYTLEISHEKKNSQNEEAFLS